LGEKKRKRKERREVKKRQILRVNQAPASKEADTRGEPGLELFIYFISFPVIIIILLCISV
jgi:hypothetical protein